MVDSAIDAMGAYLRSGANANSGGRFAASVTTGTMVARRPRDRRVAPRRGPGRHRVRAEHHDAGPRASPARSDATARTGRRGRRHPARPRLQRHTVAARGGGCRRGRASSPRSTLETGRLPIPTRSVALIGPTHPLGRRSPARRTRSARCRTCPRSSRPPMRPGARVFVDAVHLAPHESRSTSAPSAAMRSSPRPYKWYGPHAGVLWLSPELRDSAHRPTRCGPRRTPRRSAGRRAPRRTRRSPGSVPPRPSSCSIRAWRRWRRRRARCSRPCSTACSPCPTCTVHGPRDLEDRTPTVCFSVDGHTADDVAAALADEQIAVWSGNYYAVEVMAALGLAERRRRDPGGQCRATPARTMWTDCSQAVARMRRPGSPRPTRSEVRSGDE